MLGQPVDHEAKLLIAGVTGGFECTLFGEVGRFSSGWQWRAWRQLACQGLKFLAGFAKRPQLFVEKAIGPACAALDAIEQENNAEGLTARKIPFNVRNDFSAEGRDHAV